MLYAKSASTVVSGQTDRQTDSKRLDEVGALFPLNKIEALSTNTHADIIM